MTNIELIQLLSQFPPNVDIEVHLSNSLTTHKIINVYIGNERYMPGGKVDQPDKVYLESK